jgi:hypothetical protein
MQSGHNHLSHLRQYFPSFECELHLEDTYSLLFHLSNKSSKSIDWKLLSQEHI